jgi:hypothetical protein
MLQESHVGFQPEASPRIITQVRFELLWTPLVGPHASLIVATELRPLVVPTVGSFDLSVRMNSISFAFTSCFVAVSARA